MPQLVHNRTKKPDSDVRTYSASLRSPQVGLNISLLIASKNLDPNLCRVLAPIGDPPQIHSFVILPHSICHTPGDFLGQFTTMDSENGRHETSK